MKIYYYCLLVIGFTLFSCSEAKFSELLTIPVGHNQNAPLALSEVTESLIAIELELTDESLINPDIDTNLYLTQKQELDIICKVVLLMISTV